MSRLSAFLNKNISNTHLDWSQVSVLVFAWLAGLSFFFLNGLLRYTCLIFVVLALLSFTASGERKGLGRELREFIRTAKEFWLWKWSMILGVLVVTVMSVAAALFFIFFGIE